MLQDHIKGIHSGVNWRCMGSNALKVHTVSCKLSWKHFSEMLVAVYLLLALGWVTAAESAARTAAILLVGDSDLVDTSST